MSIVECLLIKNGYIITVDGEFTIYPNGAMFVEGNIIKDIGKTSDLENKYKDRSCHVIDASDQAVLPGLINTHMHSGLIRGTAEDLPVFEWLRKHVDPKHRALEAEDAYIAASLCYAESLKAGTTCVLDMYRFMDKCAEAAEETGIRAILAPYVADAAGYDYFETLEGNTKLIETKHLSANGRIHIWYGLEHLTYCTEKAYHYVSEHAKYYNVGIHTHGEESLKMFNLIHSSYNNFPVEVFWKRGILGEKTVLAHCVWLMPVEIEILKDTGTSVAHCPVSNMKLASGVAPITDLLDAGIVVGLGTDGIKENNNLDMLEEMKFASLLQKVHRLDATVMKALDTLKLATINGARALGLDHQIGSLEIGKKADFILIDMRSLHLTPLLEKGDYSNVVPNIVFSACGRDVSTVVVDGKLLLKEGRLTMVNESEIRKNANLKTDALLLRRKNYIPK